MEKTKVRHQAVTRKNTLSLNFAGKKIPAYKLRETDGNEFMMHPHHDDETVTYIVPKHLTKKRGVAIEKGS